MYFHKLIKYLQLKPKKDNKIAYDLWLKLQDLTHNERKDITDELYLYRRHVKSPKVTEEAKIYVLNLESEKYYTGHHSRLGHYFRHLFQSYKFLNSQEYLNDKDRYFYGKTLRAQLSTYEQALLFINSISNMGLKWEYKPEELPISKSFKIVNEEIKRSKMITFYNLIKNLPGNQLFGITYKTYYPNVKYETEEQ